MLLSNMALDVYSCPSDEDALDYRCLKKALLRRCNLLRTGTNIDEKGQHKEYDKLNDYSTIYF